MALTKAKMLEVVNNATDEEKINMGAIAARWRAIEHLLETSTHGMDYIWGAVNSVDVISD